MSLASACGVVEFLQGITNKDFRKRISLPLRNPYKKQQ